MGPNLQNFRKMNICNSFVCQLISYCTKSLQKNCEKNYEKTYIGLESCERVRNSLRNVYETIRNSLVTFSQVHFTTFCKLGPCMEWTDA